MNAKRAKKSFTSRGFQHCMEDAQLFLFSKKYLQLKSNSMMEQPKQFTTWRTQP